MLNKIGTERVKSPDFAILFISIKKVYLAESSRICFCLITDIVSETMFSTQNIKRNQLNQIKDSLNPTL